MPSTPEAQVACSICQQPVASSSYEYHLRQVHRMATYRGTRRPTDETVNTIVAELLSQPSEDAWMSLWHLTRDTHGDRADDALANILTRALSTLPKSRQDAFATALAQYAASQPALVSVLAQQQAPVARTLALTCLARKPTAGDTATALLADRELPAGLQRRVLVALWPSLDEEAASNLLSQTVAGMNSGDALKQLRAFERDLGAHPILAAKLAEFRKFAKLTCPRCKVELRHAQMEQHLWEEHRLILDGLKTRDPWDLIKEWLEAGKADPTAGWLGRCRVAAEKIDSDGGSIKLARLILARGLSDPSSREQVLQLARERKCACCPNCYAEVNIPREQLPPWVSLRVGRLSARGYEVRTAERGLWPSLDVRTPTTSVYRGTEPGRGLAAGMLSSLVAGTLVLVALVFACVWPVSLGLPIKVVSIFIGLAFVGWCGVRLYGRLTRPNKLSLLRHAWRFLVPKLHAEDFSADDADFAAGLAQLHARVGLIGIDANQLRRLLRVTEPAVKLGKVSPIHLAVLCRLQIEMEAQAGRDPVPLVVEWATKVFEGKLPLAFAQRLFEEWTTKWWTRTNLARLRVLLCDRAFEAGFEVGSILDAGITAPALGTVLNTAEPRSLAALRLLWSLRATRPWDKLGDVKTVYELAGDPETAVPLGGQADLLLYAEDSSVEEVTPESQSPGPAELRLTTLGVWLQGVLFRIPPRVVEVRMRSSGCTLTLGDEVFRSTEDLEPLLLRLDKWFRYSFHEFLPGVDRAMTWETPDRAAILRAWGAVPCPECGRHLLARPGEVGVALSSRT